MKKFALLAMMACAMFQTVKAENENLIYALPVHIAQNVDIDGAECGTLDIYISTTTIAAGVNFDILVPDELTFDPGYIYEGTDILPYTTNKKTGVNTFNHSIDVNEYPAQDVPGYTRYLVSVYATDGSKFKATEGVLVSFDLGSIATAAGVKPILVNNQACFYDGATKIFADKSSTSYVVFEGAESATLAITSDGTNSVELGKAVVEELANESAIKTLDLSGANALHGDFTYVAGRNVVAPTSVAANVKFDAPLAGKYGSFCAPVDVNVDCYTLTSCDGTTAVFTPATTAPAGQPVLIDKPVKTAAQAARLTTVEGRQITAGYYVAANGSGMHSVNGTATIPALRGAWEDIVASSNLRIAIETPTGIQYIGTADEVFGNTYDLQGRQVQEAHNGVFVVNGKKQFVK